MAEQVDTHLNREGNMDYVGERNFPEFLAQLTMIREALDRIAIALERRNELEANHPSRI